MTANCREPNLRQISHFLVPVIGLVLIVAALQASRQLDAEVRSLRFEGEAEETTLRVIGELENIDADLHAFRALYLSSDDVTEDEFLTFGEAIGQADSQSAGAPPLVRSIGWISWSEGAEKRSFRSAPEGVIEGLSLDPELFSELAAFDDGESAAFQGTLIWGVPYRQSSLEPRTPTLTLLVPVPANTAPASETGAAKPELLGFVFATIDLVSLLQTEASAASAPPQAQIIGLQARWGDAKTFYLAAGDSSRMRAAGRNKVLLLGRELELIFAQPARAMDSNAGAREAMIVALGGALITLLLLLLSATRRENLRILRGRRDAEAASEQKSRFLANMTHELRTPISGIIGMARLVGRSGLSEKQQAYISNLEASAEGLLAIIDDILDLSKMESDKLSIEPESVDVDKLVSSLELQFAELAAEKCLEFRIERAPLIEPKVMVDPLRVRQVLTNLIGNAIKFTHVGGVVLRVGQSASADPSRIRLEFEVQDSGVGISKEAQTRLFSRFAQADASTTKFYGGAGLGLAICKDLVELMQGEISVASAEERGSTFRFWIPVAPAEAGLSDAAPATQPSRTETRATPHHRIKSELHVRQGRIAPAAPSSRQAPVAARRDNECCRVLLVEDDPVNQLYASEVLTDLGCDVTLTSDGEQAVERAECGEFDLILMDCQMPKMDGYEASRRIVKSKSDGGSQAAPIIALTANALRGDREKCLAAGMIDYLCKPLDEEKLTRILPCSKTGRRVEPVQTEPRAEPQVAVREEAPEAATAAAEADTESDAHAEMDSEGRILAGAEAEPGAAEPESAEPGSAEPESVEPLIDDQVLSRMRERMGAKFEMLLNAYLEDSTRYIEEIETGLSEGDATAPTRAAHTMKSSSRLLGAFAVGEAAAALEALLKRDGDLSAAQAAAERLARLHRETRPHLSRRVEPEPAEVV